MILLSGIPVAFGLAALGLGSGYFGIQMGLVIPAAFMGNLPLGCLASCSNDSLLAIPFFTFMGIILETFWNGRRLARIHGPIVRPGRGGLGSR